MLARDLAGGDEAVILNRVDTLRLRDYPVTVDDSGLSVPRCAWGVGASRLRGVLGSGSTATYPRATPAIHAR
jgi:hypothetical protein